MQAQILRLGKTISIYGIGGLLNRFISFLLLPLFTSFLSTEDYGVLAILNLISLIVVSVCSLGLGAGIGPFYFESSPANRKAETIWTSFALLVGSVFILMVVGVSFSVQISRLFFQTPVFYNLVTLTLITSGLNILSIPLSLYLQFEERAKTFIVLSAISTFVTLALNVLMVVVFRRGVQGYVVGGVIAQAINLVLFFVPAILGLRFVVEPGLGFRLLKFSLPLVPSFAFIFIIDQSGKYVLQWLRGLSEVGIYSVGANLGLAMFLLVSAFQKAWYPYFMSFIEKQGEAKRLFGKITSYYVLGVGSLSMLFFFAARPVVTIMTQPAFHSSYKVVGLVACAQFLTGIFNLLLPGIYFARQVKYIPMIQSVAAVSSLIFNVALIAWLGVTGAAIALVLTYLVLIVIQHLWNRWRKYLDIQYEPRRLLLFLLLYATGSVFSLYEFPSTVPVLILVNGCGAFIFLLLVYRLLNSEERKATTEVLKGLAGQSTKLMDKVFNGRSNI